MLLDKFQHDHERQQYREEETVTRSIGNVLSSFTAGKKG